MYKTKDVYHIINVVTGTHRAWFKTRKAAQRDIAQLQAVGVTTYKIVKAPLTYPHVNGG